MRVGTTLQRNGHKVSVLDYSGKDPKGIKKQANDFDLFGFSATTPQMPYVMNLHRMLKQANPKARTVLGGPHASALYHLRKKGVKDINIEDAEVFDTIYAGEGESSELIKMFVPGWQDAGIVKNVDSVVVPDRNMIDLKSYRYKLFDKLTTSIQTQRGCPHQCIFCSGRDVEMYNRVRMHSPERVLEELDKLHTDFGFSSFMWYDDEINLNVGRLEKLCNLLVKRPYQHRGFVRSDNIVKYPESVAMMADAGFVKLCTGVESGSDRILKLLQKRATKEINTEARRIVKREGVHYEAFLLLGHPTETLEDVSETVEWVRQNKPDDFDLNLVTPYPGSKIYDEAVPSKRFADYSWDFKGLFFNKPRYAEEDSFYKGLDQQSRSNVRTEELDNRAYMNIRDSADKYLRGEIKK